MANRMVNYFMVSAMLILSLLSIIGNFAFADATTASSRDLCPADLSQYRSSKVANSFDPTKLNGMWYEIAYHDAAQVKESCQSYSRTVTKSETSGGYHMEEMFGFTYADHSPEPHALKMAVDFHSGDNELGLYDRYLDFSVMSRLKFPAVVVDFTTTRNGEYDTVSEYLCYNIGKIPYREIRIGSRSPTMSDAQLLVLEQNLKALGVPFEMLRRANQTNCSYINK